jgi:hypothetical protein
MLFFFRPPPLHLLVLGFQLVKLLAFFLHLAAGLKGLFINSDSMNKVYFILTEPLLHVCID